MIFSLNIFYFFFFTGADERGKALSMFLDEKFPTFMPHLWLFLVSKDKCYQYLCFVIMETHCEGRKRLVSVLHATCFEHTHEKREIRVYKMEWIPKVDHIFELKKG